MSYFLKKKKPPEISYYSHNLISTSDKSALVNPLVIRNTKAHCPLNLFTKLIADVQVPGISIVA